MSDQPLKHVKLSFKDDRIVLPVTAKTGKVALLLAEATVRFRAQRLLDQDDSFIQVSTIDGYTINPNDSIEDIISNGDHLVLQNRAAWISTFLKSHNATYWFDLSSYDYKASLTRKISVGYVAAKSTIVISLWKGRDTRTAMEPFDRDTLTSYAKDGDVLVLHEASPAGQANGYDLSAFFVVKQGKATAIRLQVKTASDPQAQIAEWPITIGDDAITAGEKKEIQGNWPAAPSKEFTLPQTTVTGKHLEAPTPRPVRDFGAEPNPSTGDSVLIYHQTSEVSPEKYSGSDETLQTFRVEFSVTNNSEVDTSIVRTLAEYKKEDGSWESFPNILRGMRSSDWDWNLRGNTSDALRVGARDVFKFALGARLTLAGNSKPLNTRLNGVSPSLPVPLELRFTFTDQDGKSSAVTVTCHKRGYDLPSLEYMQKNHAGLQKYWFVDDAINGERLGAFYVKNEKDNYVRIASDSSYYQLTADTLHSETYKAVEAGETERQLSKYEYGNYAGTISLLFDLETKYAYGCRIRLSCNGASLDESFLLPKECW